MSEYVTIFSVDGNGVFTGNAREVPVADGAPNGWTYGEPPTVPPGKVAVKTAGEWVISDPPPRT
jgi:hypothetical protein